jgi:hypothetical protein
MNHDDLRPDARTSLHFFIAVGALWGVAEAGLGVLLKGACSLQISGSVMTSVALCFAATAQAFSPRKMGLLILVALAAGLKMLSAPLVGVSVAHGSIANPCYAYVSEVAAFWLLASVLDSRLSQRLWGNMITGALMALVAVNLFPLVRFVTATPACVMKGTGYPVALYYAPIAVGLSAVTVPLGRLAGAAARESPVLLRAPRLICDAAAAVSVVGVIVISVLT